MAAELTEAQREVLLELAAAEPDQPLKARPPRTFRGLRDAGLVTLHYSSDGDWAEMTAAGNKIAVQMSKQKRR